MKRSTVRNAKPSQDQCIGRKVNGKVTIQSSRVPIKLMRSRGPWLKKAETDNHGRKPVIIENRPAMIIREAEGTSNIFKHTAKGAISPK